MNESMKIFINIEREEQMIKEAVIGLENYIRKKFPDCLKSFGLHGNRRLVIRHIPVEPKLEPILVDPLDLDIDLILKSFIMMSDEEFNEMFEYSSNKRIKVSND
jgi:hypothetical protein